MGVASDWTGTISRRSPMEAVEFYLAVMAVFLTPMNFLKFFGIYITASDFFAIACLFLMVINRGLPMRPFAAATPVWLIGIILLVTGLMMSSLVNGDPTRGMIVSAQYFYSMFLLPLIIVTRPWNELIILVKAFLASIILMCFFGLYFIHIDGQTQTQWVSGNGRLRSWIGAANATAGVLALTIPLLMWTSRKQILSKYVVWPALALCIYNVMLTASNTGLIMSLFGLSVFLFFTFSVLQIAVAGLCAIALVMVIAQWGSLFLPDIFQQRVLSALGSGDIDQAGTFADRFELITEALQFSNHTILIGLGVDQYRVLSELEKPVHNIYLLLLTEGGLIALIGFLTIILAWISPAFINRSKASFGESDVCCLTTIASFLVLINATPHVYGRFWILPLVLSVSLSIASAQNGDVPLRLRRQQQ